MHAMADMLPAVFLVRHGETEWSLSGQHTGLTDIPLTQRGEKLARQLGKRLQGIHFDRVLTSPLQRAHRTCELAGFGGTAEVNADLVEWDYGAYEGRRRVDILAERPGWDLFRDGVPDGESPALVGDRVDRVIVRLRSTHGNALVFSSGHFLRVLIARWLDLAPAAGRHFILATASISVLGYEHELTQPAIRLLNAKPDLLDLAAP
jgi:probable phosphoglycerate mutase